MKKKFRIKLKGGRVVGPFSASQVGELYLKGHINGSENCQVYPQGDWEGLKSFEDLKDVILKIITNDENSKIIDDSTKIDTIARLDLLGKIKEGQLSRIINKENSFNEFQFKKERAPSITFSDKKNKEVKIEEKGPSSLFSVNDQEETSAEIERTLLQRAPVLETDKSELEKTVLLNKEIIHEIEAVEEIAEHEIEVPIAEETKICTDEETQFIKSKDFLLPIKQEALEFEKKSNKKVEKDLLVKKKEQEQDGIRKIGQSKNKEIKKKKTTKPIFVIVALAMIFFVLTDEEKQERPLPSRIKITFPVTQKYEDPAKAKILLEKGIISYQKNTFVSKTFAAKYFRSSLSFKFRDSKALGWLILTYAEIYGDAKSKAKAASTIYRLIKIGEAKRLSDENVAVGSALFFSSFGKYKTSINIIENFLRVGKPSLKLLTIYLSVLLNDGELTKARKVFNKLKEVPKKSEEVTLALASFLEQDEKQDEADILIKEGLRKYKLSIPLILKSAQFEFEKNNYKSFKKHLNLLKELNSGSSPIYYAKYLEYLGVYFASQKKLTQAAAYFNKALRINESDDLRSKLAALSLGGTESVEALILQSKVIYKMKDAKIAIKEKDWGKALKLSIEGADLLPSYIPAQLLLVKIQIERGLFGSAIKTLAKLRKENPLNASINFYLILAYIESLKLEDADRLKQMISQTNLRHTAQYASVLGKYYLKKENDVLAIKWFRESIKRFPLNDLDYSLLAKIYLKNRKYDNALQMISEAIALDPRNILYRSLYAKILYERSDVDAALGYLRDLLDEHKENPTLLGEIAIYYYRSGQVKNFNLYKKRIEDLPKKDKGFYEFLIKAAKLDERYQDVITYSKELIKISPGDLETRMIMGEYLFKEEQLPQAADIFNSILERLEGFPRANYYLAKISIKKRDFKQALSYAELEVKLNQTLKFGYYIRGEVYKKLEKYLKASSNFEKAISIDSKYVEALMGLGWLKHRQNFFEEARELYLRARKNDSSNPKIYRALGYAYKATGDSGYAMESFQTYLDISPAAPDRIKIEKEIKSLR